MVRGLLVYLFSQLLCTLLLFILVTYAMPTPNILRLPSGLTSRPRARKTGDAVQQPKAKRESGGEYTGMKPSGHILKVVMQNI